MDRFHHQNTYIICLRDRRLLGMVAVRAERPFSLDAKLENLMAYLPPGRSVCEVRLLAVAPGHRRGKILGGLLREVVEYCGCRGYDLAVISGTVRQERLYRRLGFVPFGPRVGTAEAAYQPMYLKAESLRARIPWVCGPACGPGPTG